MEGKLSYLRRYHKGIELVSDGIEKIDEIPEAWKMIFSKPAKQDRIAAAIALWSEFAAHDLRNTAMYLKENLVDVDLIKYQGKYSLLYSVLSAGKEVLYYEGGNPKTISLPDKLGRKWNELPTGITAFYEKLHDGFFYYASGGMGLLPVRGIVIFDDEDWGILDDLSAPLEICLQTTFGLFGSGMGGYVAIDTSNCDNGNATLWFANQQPRYHIDFWDVVDEWIVIGMQE